MGITDKQTWEELVGTGKRASCLRRANRCRKRWKQQRLTRALHRARDEAWSLDFLLLKLKKEKYFTRPFP